VSVTLIPAQFGIVPESTTAHFQSMCYIPCSL
jgi:hypothetical protein